MILQFNPAETKEEQAVAVSPNKQAPIITIDHPTIEAKSGSGNHLEVVRIDIKDSDGKSVGKFWVDATLNNQGRPVLHISTNVGNGTHTKRLVGSWRDGYAHSMKLS